MVEPQAALVRVLDETGEYARAEALLLRNKLQGLWRGMTARTSVGLGASECARSVTCTLTKVILRAKPPYKPSKKDPNAGKRDQAKDSDHRCNFLTAALPHCWMLIHGS